jgi:hypothetical protein
MSTHHKEPCPCGSGKRYKHCHMAKDEARRRNVFLGVIAAIVVVAAAGLFAPKWLAQQAAERAAKAAIATARADSAAGRTNPIAAGAGDVPVSQAFGVRTPLGTTSAPVPDPNALSLKPPNSGELAPGEHPAPWEYDVALNRHYDPRPGHMHWHTGPPPADPTALSALPQVTTTGSNGAVVTTTSPMSSTPLLPNEHPKPWEYDAKKDRHYDPRLGHEHWHSGPPPPPANRTGTLGPRATASSGGAAPAAADSGAH